MPKGKQIKKADSAHYVLCPACSDEEGEEVFYHRRALKRSRPFLSDKEQLRCPLDHELEIEGEE